MTSNPAICVVDASVWVSAFVQRDANYAASFAWLMRQFAGGRGIVAPTLVLPEVAGAITRRTGDITFTRRVIADMRQFTGLRLVGLTKGSAARAAAHSADLRLRGADAIYVEVAHRLGIPLVTWDRELLTRAAAIVQAQTP